MSINTDSYGTLNKKYVRRIQDTIKGCLDEYPRTIVLRMDLRLPDIDDKLYNADASVITRFTISLRAQIVADQLRKRKAGKRIHDCRVRLIWVREFNACGKKHYHVALLLNREAYAYPGSYTRRNGSYTHCLAIMIMEAWVRSLGLNNGQNHEQYYSLIEFPTNGCYHLSRNKKDFVFQSSAVTERLKYLAKDYSKDNSDGHRNFGCSQF